jgi:hypothetical protein
MLVRRVLVVDDEEPIARAFARILQTARYETHITGHAGGSNVPPPPHRP